MDAAFIVFIVSLLSLSESVVGDKDAAAFPAVEEQKLPIQISDRERTDTKLNSSVAIQTDPIRPVIVLESNTSLSISNDSGVNSNTTITSLPKPEDIEPPEVSERRLNVPGLITPDKLKNILGASCTSNSNCTALNTVCQGGNCICLEGYRASKHKMDACVKIPKELNDSCETDSECDSAFHASECIDGVCACPQAFVPDQGACWEKRAMGDACDTTAQCLEIPNAACLQGVCACPVKDYVPSPTSSKCLHVSTFESECIEDIQCTEMIGDDSRCFDMKCFCKEGYHYNGSKCLIDRKLRSSCITNEDCIVSLSTELADRRACVNNNCTCATGYKVLMKEDGCVKDAADSVTVSLSWLMCIIIARYFI